MTEIKAKYETIFIVDRDKSEQETSDIVEKFKSLIESAGEIEKVDLWGKRRLAYPINDKSEGYYVMVTFVAPPEFPRELDRVYGITDGLVRSLTVRCEELGK